MKKFILALGIGLLLAGCSNSDSTSNSESIYNKAIEQAKLALANGEYNKALASFKLALDEKPDDEEAKASYDILVAFNQVIEDVEEAKWDEAIKQAENLLEKETLPSGIKKDLEEYKQTAEESKEQYQTVLEKVEQLKGLVNAQKYSEAQALASELKQDQSIKDVFSIFSEEVAEIENTINEELQKQKEAEELAAKKKVEAEAAAAKKKAEYLQKLNNIEKGLSDLDYLYANGVTSELIEAESETLKRWDDALNEIYGELKKQLSTSEMSKLREKQRTWITFRDKTADNAAAEFEGGTFEPLQWISTKAQLTKERCYELVEDYM